MTLPKPVQCGSPVARAVTLVACCGVAAQPLEGVWGSADAPTVPDVPPGPAKVQCPDGFYKSSMIIWHCGGAIGKGFVYMQPHVVQTALKIPVGVRDFKLSTEASVDASMELVDEATGESLVNEQTFSRTYQQMELSLTGHSPGVPGQDTLGISGKVATPLSLKFLNHADRWSTITVDYRFEGLSSCPVLPIGCSPYDQSAAMNEVKAWSTWVQSKYANVIDAWKDLAQPFAETVGRRLLAQQQAVPWYRWDAIWAAWGASGGGGWQQAFRFLDLNGDGQITLGEFARGYALGAAPSAPGGFAVPVWLLWAVPLLAVVCLLLRFFVKDPARLAYHHLSNFPKVEGLHRPSSPINDEGLNKAHHARAPPDTEAAPAKVDAASDTPRGAPEHWFETRSLRACDTPFAKLGLLDCGMRGKSTKSKNVVASGRPHCSKCGWEGRCPCCRREGRVLPPVLAWRGPDESHEDDEVHSIIRAMNSEPENAFVQETSLERLEELALGTNAKKKIADFGGIKAIIDAMCNHPLVVSVQENACGALGNEALRSEQCQKLIGEEGGIEAIIRAMADHPGVSSMQEKACWALQQLAMIHYNRLEISKRGGVNHITYAMTTHAESETVQEHGCMALGNLAFEVETREIIVVKGGMDAIVNAMHCFPGAQVLQENGCFALHNLACSDEAMPSIVDAGGIEAVIQAMKEHPLEAGVQENAIAALHNVNCGPIKFVHKVAALGGVELIVRAMHSHSVAGLQAKACHVLGQLGDRDDEVRRQIQQAGGFAAIASARAKFEASKEVQRSAKEAMAILQEDA